MELNNVLERVTAELDIQELELKQFKRITVKEAFDSKFDAMLEYAEKMALIAGYGRAITLVIDTETQTADVMRVYNGGEYTASVVNQVKAAVTNWQPQPVNAPVRTHIAPTQDELALSAAAIASITKTPPLSHNSYTANDGYSSSPTGAQENTDVGQLHDDRASDRGFASPTHAEQVTRIQEQQRKLELEQQRLYQKNLASYSPEQSHQQQHYQDTAGSNGHGGSYDAYSPPPPRSNTQEIYSPSLPGYESGSIASPSQGYGRNSQYQYEQYDGTSSYGTPARNYRLGFVDPRERTHMEQNRYGAELQQPSLPPLQFSQSPILHEK